MYDEEGKKIKKSHNNGELLGNSSEIVVVKDNNYLEVYDEDTKKYQDFIRK